MKQIQKWLGHSDFSTTANIYAHLDNSSKLTSADAMLNGLGIGSPQSSPRCKRGGTENADKKPLEGSSIA